MSFHWCPVALWYWLQERTRTKFNFFMHLLVDVTLLCNNNNGHFYGAWSLARSRAHCAVQKAAEKCINTYNGQGIKNKSFGLYARQPRKNLHTGISVNKPELPVTKHDQTLILAHMHDTSRYTANTKKYSGILHTHTHLHTYTHTHGRGGY